MKHKILSFLTAFAMVFGIIAAPFVNASAADNQGTKSVTLHKILQPKSVFDNWPQNGTTTGKDSKEYIGDDITKKTIENYGQEGKENASTSTIESFFGTGSKEIDGVYFAWQYNAGTKDNPDWKYIKGKMSQSKKYNDGAELKEGKLQEATDVKQAMGGLTGNTGFKFDTSELPAGDYQIQEIPSLSTYTGANKETLTGTKAVPVKIHLPLANKDGVVENAHVYPKNTEEKPTTNKDFSDQFNDKQKDGRDAGTEEASQVNNPTEKTKDQQSHNVGDKIPYTVKTTIPVNAKYATAYWSDEMTEGLTFDKNLKVTLNGITLVPTVDYTVEDGTNGFKASLTEAGLEKVNGKDTVQTLVLTYSATINSKAVTQIPESNDVTFHYGNNKSEGNTPIPTKPNENGDLEVKKTWDNGEWAAGEKATFVLVDAQTGEQVAAKDLVAPNGNAEDPTFKAYKENADGNGFSATVDIGYNVNGGSHTWKYLNKDKQYKAIEINRTNGENAEYKKGTDGQIIVVNHKDNTQEINPTEPKVKTGEKKFVKRDKNTNERLANAEFVVSAQIDNETKYLIEKTEEEIKKQEKAITDARTALDTAVENYKKAKEDTEKATALAAFEQAQTNLNNAILANVKYYWSTDKSKAKKYKSNKDGQVIVEGLKNGHYTLIETKAPDKYALPDNAKWNFEIGGTSDLTDVYDVANEKTDKYPKDAIRMDNTLVSIPQTGGIGSIIFIVAGLTIMGLAAYKMKANKEEA